MAVTILEALYNAQVNLVDGRLPIQKILGAEQLNNAIVLLEKGYPAHQEVEPLLEQYENVNDVPEKQ
jgi:hypothetical protein